MTVPRLSVLLASGLLALAPAAPALAQSAGDEQYSDPLGGQTEDGGSTQSSPGLTDAPQDVEGDSGTAAPALPLGHSELAALHEIDHLIRHAVSRQLGVLRSHNIVRRSRFADFANNGCSILALFRHRDELLERNRLAFGHT